MSEANEVITHEGAQYRKVDREAAAGELIQMTSGCEFGDFYVGDVFTVVEREFFDQAGDARDIIDHKYVVLEPLVDAAPTPTRLRIVNADDQLGVGYRNGDEVTLVKRWANGLGADVVDSSGNEFELYAEEYEVIGGDTADDIAASLPQGIVGQSREVVRTPGGEVVFKTVLSAPDNIEKPAHYNAGKVEVIELIEQLTAGYDGYTAYCLGNVIKYIARAPYKHDEPTEDLRKAERYLAYALAAISAAD